jgi:glycosyltransferase involved in cell wall biosynthesis
MRRSCFDAAHFHNSKLGLLGRLAARLAHTSKVIYTVHGWCLNRSTTGRLFPLMSLAERAVARMSTAVVFVAKNDMETGLHNKWACKSNAVLIHNGIAVTPERGERDGVNEPVIIFVARLAEPKEPLLALQISELLQRDGCNHRMLIVGDGPQYPICAKYISEHQLHAAMLGKRDDVRELLESSDVFCLFSKWEGLPISILEAMAAGLPVVASAVGGIPEMVEHGKTGYLVEGFSTETAAAYIKILLGDSGLRRQMGNAARTIVRERFALDNMVTNYRRIYEAPSSHRGRRAVQ